MAARVARGQGGPEADQAGLQDADGDGDEHGTCGQCALLVRTTTWSRGEQSTSCATVFSETGMPAPSRSIMRPRPSRTGQSPPFIDLAHRVPRGDLVRVGGMDDGEDVGVRREVWTVGVEQRQHVAILMRRRREGGAVLGPVEIRAVGIGFGGRGVPAVQPEMGGEGEIAIDRDAETVGLRHQRIDVGRVQPVAAEIERHARRQILGVGAAADAVRGFDHLMGEAGLGGRARRADAGGAGADDDEVEISA